MKVETCTLGQKFDHEVLRLTQLDAEEKDFALPAIASLALLHMDVSKLMLTLLSQQVQNKEILEDGEGSKSVLIPIGQAFLGLARDEALSLELRVDAYRLFNNYASRFSSPLNPNTKEGQERAQSLQALVDSTMNNVLLNEETRIQILEYGIRRIIADDPLVLTDKYYHQSNLNFLANSSAKFTGNNEVLNAAELVLPPQPYTVFKILFDNLGRVVTNEEIMQILGVASLSRKDNVMSDLRRKLDELGFNLKTKPKNGYVLSRKGE